jgi:hypothetical protein
MKRRDKLENQPLPPFPWATSMSQSGFLTEECEYTLKMPAKSLLK